MQTMRKVFCIVDTSALRHWKKLELSRKSLDRWLKKEFNVRVSESVKNEVNDQQDHWIDGAKRIMKLVQDSQHYLSDPEVFEKALLSHFLNNDNLNIKEGAGERRNFCVTIDLVRCYKCRHAIFLTDDYKAVNNFLESAFFTFRVSCIWSSYDFILYLFFRHNNIISLKDAQNAIRSLTANMIPRGGSKSKWLNKEKKYLDGLQIIAYAMEKLPKEDAI